MEGEENLVVEVKKKKLSRANGGLSCPHLLRSEISRFSPLNFSSMVQYHNGKCHIPRGLRSLSMSSGVMATSS